MSHLEDTLAFQLKAAGLPSAIRELRFHSTRAWRFDFAWPELMLALEIDGGTFTNGRHSRGKGYEADCLKLNEAAIAGWRVLKVTGDMVYDGRALQTAERAIEQAMQGEAA